MDSYVMKNMIMYVFEKLPQKRRLSAREVEVRLGHDYGPRMLSVVSHCYQWFILPGWARVLTAELGRFAADTHTAPGFLKRLHNHCTKIVHVRVLRQHAVAKQRRVAHACLELIIDDAL